MPYRVLAWALRQIPLRVAVQRILVGFTDLEGNRAPLDGRRPIATSRVPHMPFCTRPANIERCVE